MENTNLLLDRSIQPEAKVTRFNNGKCCIVSVETHFNSTFNISHFSDEYLIAKAKECMDIKLHVELRIADQEQFNQQNTNQ